MVAVMQDAFAHCAALVRSADRDRFLATLFAPAERRDALFALYAFNAEVARVRDIARQALPGEIRLQWWSEVLDGTRAEEARANPVAFALLAAIERHALSAAALQDLIEARRFDLYDEPMRTLDDLETYARRTTSTLFALALQILVDGAPVVVAEPAGKAYAIASLLRAFAVHASRGQCYVPLDITERHNVKTADIFAGRSTSGLALALAELRSVCRHHLAAVHGEIGAVPGAALPVLLPLAPLRQLLDRMERRAPFENVDLPPWRRQWLIWRAARNPARLAA